MKNLVLFALVMIAVACKKDDDPAPVKKYTNFAGLWKIESASLSGSLSLVLNEGHNQSDMYDDYTVIDYSKTYVIFNSDTDVKYTLAIQNHHQGILGYNGIGEYIQDVTIAWRFGNDEFQKYYSLILNNGDYNDDYTEFYFESYEVKCSEGKCFINDQISKVYNEKITFTRVE